MIKPKGQGGLGFRDIHGFNIAMLYWKVWCLIQNPNSLCAIILKAQYFPDCHILDAKPAENMSYTWTSILHGAELVKKVWCGVLETGSNSTSGKTCGFLEHGVRTYQSSYRTVG
jgi:hypothetical protein